MNFSLTHWMASRNVSLWGVADLTGFSTPVDKNGLSFPRAISLAIPMSAQIMAGIQSGPNEAYAAEYSRVNDLINELCTTLAAQLRAVNIRALALAASERTDPVNIRGDFPQKTAATRAGIGWIGRHCQLVTRRFGPWVRLGTVFCDLDIPAGKPMERSFCGKCTHCVEACPANALTGNAWRPGVERSAILNAAACDQYKKKHFYHFHKGHNCGICSAACPHGQKTLRNDWQFQFPHHGASRS